MAEVEIWFNRTMREAIHRGTFRGVKEGTGRENRSVRSDLQQLGATVRLDCNRRFDFREGPATMRTYFRDGTLAKQIVVEFSAASPGCCDNASAESVHKRCTLGRTVFGKHRHERPLGLQVNPRIRNQLIHRGGFRVQETPPQGDIPLLIEQPFGSITQVFQSA